MISYPIVFLAGLLIGWHHEFIIKKIKEFFASNKTEKNVNEEEEKENNG
jgi:hypothetical protein